MMILVVPLTVIVLFLARFDFNRFALMTVGKYFMTGVERLFLANAEM